MAITEWSPFGRDDEDVPSRRRRRNAPAFRNLQREMNRLFDDFFENSALRRTRGDRTPSNSSTRSFRPRIDVSEDDESLKVSAELPGLDKEDIQLTADDDSLTIRGEKSYETEEEDEDEGYYRSERSYGYFQRRIPFPVDVDTSEAKATFQDGVLDVRFPKTGESSGERLEIETD